MKTIFRIFFFVSVVGFFSRCEEIGPQINTGGGNTDTTETKHVLVELFTAVRCPNCPNGISLLEDIIDQYPEDEVEVVELHNGALSTPFSYSNYDFHIQEADDIEDMLGGFPFQPSAAIDRRRWFDQGDTTIIVGTGSWALYIDSITNENLKVKINLVKNYNTTTRELQVDAQIEYLQDVLDDNNVSVMVTESNIIDPQEQYDLTVDTFFIHKNVLRGMMTPFNGDPITGDKIAGSVFTKSYSMTLPVEWNANECRVVLFVSNVNGSFDVLQVIGEDVN